MQATPFTRHLPFIDEGIIAANKDKFLYIESDPEWGLVVPADSGYVINDGPGALEIRISDDGEHYTKVQTVESGGSAIWENDDDIWIHTIHMVADANGAAYKSGFARSRW